MTATKIIPLRIPSGWRVGHNAMYEDGDLSEDMLQLEYTHGSPIIVDLGWYKDHYQLNVIDADYNWVAHRQNGLMGDPWDAPIRQAESTSRAEIIETLERWLIELS